MQCDFCNERKGIKTIYNEIYGNHDRTVFETEKFWSVPCMGQLREGHLLIISKEHINAMGMLELEALKEIKRILKTIAEFYKKEYEKDLMCFEHGVLDDQGNQGGCGIYHMHLHVLPVNKQEFAGIKENISQDKVGEIVEINKLEELKTCIEKKQTYLFLGIMEKSDQGEMDMVKNENNYFESQYLRKVVSKIIGCSEWNWKKIGIKEETFFETLQKARQYGIKF
ncbi:HIT family protein [Mediterraneibacter sp.]